MEQEIRKVKQALDILRSLMPSKESSDWVHYRSIESNLVSTLDYLCELQIRKKGRFLYLKLEEQFLSDTDEDVIHMEFGEWVLHRNPESVL